LTIGKYRQFRAKYGKLIGIQGAKIGRQVINQQLYNFLFICLFFFAAWHGTYCLTLLEMKDRHTL